MGHRRAGHALLIVAAALPLAFLSLRALRGDLGANPIETIEHTTGDWALRSLLAALAVTPLRRLTGWNGVIRYRRTVGLIAFSYVCLHFLIYVMIDQGFPFQGFAIKYIAKDIAKRPYVTVGFSALLLLIPLAWTSTKGWIRQLGGARWNALHRLIYPAAALASLHYLWLVKGKQWTPLWYALAVVLLLALRLRPGRPTARPRAPDAPRTDDSRPPRSPATVPSPS